MTSLACGPDGTVAVAGADGTVEIRDLDGGRVLRTLPHPLGVRQVARSPDGRVLATSTVDGSAIRLWDPGTGRLLAQLAGHLDSPPNSLAFSPDGDELVSTGADDRAGVWHLDPADAVERICRSPRRSQRPGGPPLPGTCP